MPAPFRWIGDPEQAGVVLHRRFEVIGAGLFPGSVWTPAAAAGPRPLVLLGYGSGGSSRDESRLWQAETIVTRYGLAAASIDIPGHGERASADGSRPDYGPLVDAIIDDWRMALDVLATLPELDTAHSAYRGVSLGTMLGLPLVAAESRIRAAVLGLAGLRDEPGFASGIGARLATDAPRLTVPVLFNVQWDDELIDRDAALRLFGAIGSPDKRLHSHPGLHHETPQHETEAELRFLAEQLLAS